MKLNLHLLLWHETGFISNRIPSIINNLDILIIIVNNLDINNLKLTDFVFLEQFQPKKQAAGEPNVPRTKKRPRPITERENTNDVEVSTDTILLFTHTPYICNQRN